MHKVHEGSVGELVNLAEIDLLTVVKFHQYLRSLHDNMALFWLVRIMHFDRHDKFFLLVGQSVILKLLVEDRVEVSSLVVGVFFSYWIA